jgi:hypothetical protein
LNQERIKNVHEAKQHTVFAKPLQLSLVLATNGYIMYSNVVRKYDTVNDNSFQPTFQFIRYVHGKINTRMKQDYAENLKFVQEK